MADNDNKRRLRRPIRSRTTAPKAQRPADPAAASVFPQPAAPMPDWAQPARRSAREQAHQDVTDVTAFLAKVDRQRAQGHSTPKPRPMRDVLGAFNSSPKDQTMIQVLAAAATARHLEGAQSANAQRWERLAQENAARLEALRSQQYHREQAAYQAARMTPEQIQQRDTERANAEAGSDKRTFDAAAAVALGYVAARGLPSFDKLESLSTEHLTVPEPSSTIEITPDPAVELVPEHESDLEAQTALDTESAAEEGPGAEYETEPEPGAPEEPEAESDADVSSDLEPVSAGAAQQEPSRGSAGNEMGQALQRAGRGIASAIGPTHGDDEVAPNLSPVNLSQLSQELLDALGAVKLAHPRSAKEMLNIEREPDQNNEVAFTPEMGTERDLSMTPDM